ncbi:MAG: voltage-gated sodium channel [Oceanicaulis sp.]|uniref:ion transporter n=1 Tax=Oceanicaulis sp. UBA2681 TaxID=1947007 RepID=UPI000C0AF0CF|nr:ion transporter [Oceanicaulis sp. UBA2681]MAP48181.1 voltage-gated sodium channel [Oceanicaulis sp.]|tara:strand:- start:4074 stop:4952 length:879 start_codon:yes stop_codon:yes gene_type:complete
MSDVTPEATKNHVARLLDSAAFRNTITTLILVNAAILGLLTYPLPELMVQVLTYADHAIIAAFVVEIVLKVFVHRLNFFKSGWNWFDFLVVAISLVPAAGAFTVLRALRVLRLFRLFSVIPEMRSVVEALGKAIPGMGAIMLVLGVIFYVASVMGAKLFSGTHPQFFGDLGGSAYTLFQVMTLESWSMGIARPVIAEHPFAWIFFVGFVIVTSFAVLNLFIAVIVDSMQSKHFDAETERQAEAHDEREVLIHEVRALRSELADLRELLGKEGGGDQPSMPSLSDSNRADKAE